MARELVDKFKAHNFDQSAEPKGDGNAIDSECFDLEIRSKRQKPEP